MNINNKKKNTNFDSYLKFAYQSRLKSLELYIVEKCCGILGWHMLVPKYTNIKYTFSEQRTKHQAHHYYTST